jgi:hypothetical protein
MPCVLDVFARCRAQSSLTGRRHALSLADVAVVELPQLLALAPRLPAMASGAEREDALLVFVVAPGATQGRVEAVPIERGFTGE